VVDLFVRPGSPTTSSPAGGSSDAQIAFADAGGVSRGEELVALSKRIRDLEARINGWENDKNVKADDVAARKADLARMQGEKAALEKPQTPPPGSYFRYSMVEVRSELGVDDGVAQAMLAFYKRVNDHNKTAFADRKPPAPEKGKAGYIGNEECASCHEDAKKVWDGTAHAHAYATLEKESKEYNLDCVSCHVTGYGKPGGSTVTYVESLKNVGCEECHGPGSRHAASQLAKDIVKEPNPQACVSACHHPPHVEGFDAVAKTKLILGPGHGMPLGGAPAPSSAPSATPSAAPSTKPGSGKSH
jgi:outer membrane murein-binding lipoprotein Lpp